MSDRSTRPAIVGTGLVSAVGVGVSSLWNAAGQRRSGIAPLQSPHFRSDRICAFGGVDGDITAACRAMLSPQLRRCSPDAVAWGIAAIDAGLRECTLAPGRDGLRYGLYASQGGYTHPSLHAYAELLLESRTGGLLDVRTLARLALKGRRLDPFLVIKSLSNGLVGAASLHFGIEGPCGAFMQGAAGTAAALRTATQALEAGTLDVAIVVAAGSDLDALALMDLARADIIGSEGAMHLLPFDEHGRGGIAGEGAAAVILRRQTDAPGSVCTAITGIHSRPALTHMAFHALSCDLMTCTTSGRPARDRATADQLQHANVHHIINTQALTGILGSAGALVDLVFAREALLRQHVPTITGLSRPVAPHLPFALNDSPAELRCAQVLSIDGNGHSIAIRLERVEQDPKLPIAAA